MPNPVRFAFLLLGAALVTSIYPLNAAGDSSPTGNDDAAVLLQRLAQENKREIETNILPFWLNHIRNPDTKGFYGSVSSQLEPRKDDARGSLLTSRILWTFSAAYRRDPRKDYKEMADWALNDLKAHFWDKEKGGVFWSIEASGKPKAREKQIYAQAFAVYGLSEYARAFGDKPAQELAVELYRLMEKHAYEPVHGGYVELCAPDWTRVIAKTNTLMGRAAGKSQNTNLHVMEALTNLLRIWPDPGLKARQGELIRVMSTKILNPKTHHLYLFQNDDWTPLTQEYSYGHDIEFSWLLTEAAEVLDDPAVIAEARKTALAIVEVTAREGMDKDGGIFHEGEDGKVTGKGKEWWPQAEALVGFLNAYQISGDNKYLQLAVRSWEFIQKYQVDRVHGEWLMYATDDPTLLKRMPKASFWKCPYHNGRACLEVVERVQHLTAH